MVLIFLVDTLGLTESPLVNLHSKYLRSLCYSSDTFSRVFTLFTSFTTGNVQVQLWA